MSDTVPLSRYELGPELGRGGMATVHRATDTHTGSQVAVKLLLEQRTHAEPDRDRMFAEVVALAPLAHDNIVRILNFTADRRGCLYLVMEYLDGPNLADDLAERGSYPPSTAVDILTQLAAALTFAHAHGVVHRDVKPANVLLVRADGRVRVVLIDFGIAAAMERRDRRLTGAHEVVGSYEYMSPERWEGGGGPPADVYAAGAVLFELLTGTTPYLPDDDSELPEWQQVRALHLAGDVPRASERSPGVPEGLDAVIARAMARDESERYATADDFARAARVAIGPPVQEQPEPMKQPAEPVEQPAEPVEQPAEPVEHVEPVGSAVELEDDAASDITGRPPERATGRWRWRWVAVTGAVLLAAAVGVGVAPPFGPPTLRAEAAATVTGARPGALIPVEGSGAQRIAVGTESGTVALVDPATGSVVAQVPVGGVPQGLASGEDGTVYVSLADATMVTVDPAADTVTGRHDLPAGQGRVAVVGAGSDGRVYGTGEGDGYALSMATPSWRMFGLPAAPVALTAAGGRAYFLVPDGTSTRIEVVDTASQRLLPPIVGLPANATDLAATDDGVIWVVADGLYIVRPGENAVRVPDVGGPRAVAATADDVYVLADTDEVLRVNAGGVVVRTPLRPTTASAGEIAVGPTGCVAVLRGDEVDTLGSGSSCSGSA